MTCAGREPQLVAIWAVMVVATHSGESVAASSICCVKRHACRSQARQVGGKHTRVTACQRLAQVRRPREFVSHSLPVCLGCTNVVVIAPSGRPTEQSCYRLSVAHQGVLVEEEEEAREVRLGMVAGPGVKALLEKDRADSSVSLLIEVEKMVTGGTARGRQRREEPGQ
eukprot:6619481-Prymnesium_polylepis.1